MNKYMLIALGFTSTLLAAVCHLAFAVVWAAGWALGRTMPYCWWGWGTLALLAAWWAALLWGHYRGRFATRTRRVTLSFPTLPAEFDGYRISHISDLHLDCWSGHGQRLARLVEHINGLQPDALVFTGDLVSVSDEEVPPFTRILGKLQARDGVYAVLGNHDYLPYNGYTAAERARRMQRLIAAERGMGWQVLLNESAVIGRGSSAIAIAGCENHSMGSRRVVMRGNLQQALRGTAAMFTVLLTHDPTHWRGQVLEQTSVPLTLSGHTHGGQVRLLGWHLGRLLFSEAAGLFEHQGRYLYVNTGLGGTLPTRVGVPPEVTVITLRRKTATALQ